MILIIFIVELNNPQTIQTYLIQVAKMHESKKIPSHQEEWTHEIWQHGV